MFDPRTHPSNHLLHPFDLNGGYGSWTAVNCSTKADLSQNGELRGPEMSFAAQHQEKYKNRSGGGVQFDAQTREDETGTFSPPLWKESQPVSRPINNYRNLSPNSRAQAIARGQWELMEMVKNMPESCYELSLKDLVEHPRLEPQEEKFNQRERLMKRQESKRGDRNNAKMVRSGSFENGGFLLKMVFPISLGSKKKTKNLGTSISSRVTPRLEASCSDKSLSKGVDKEWWRKRSSASSESESIATSSRGGSTSSGSRSSSSGGSSRSNSGRSSRKINGCSSSCWSFFLSEESRGHAE
ncbi:hypothetical protein NMG60_11032866 [Bertholletia excelsa]